VAGSSIFKEWDADPDRRVSRIEFAQTLRSMGLQPAEKQMQLMFRKIDPTASGFVDRQQLRRALEPWLEAKPIAPVALPMPPLPLRQQLAAPPTPPTLAELAAVGETKAAPASPLPVVPTTKPGVFNVPTLDHLQRLLISSPFRQSERVAVERAEAKAAAAGAGTAAAAAAALAKKALPTMEEERI
jgi:hypothetical protein